MKLITGVLAGPDDPEYGISRGPLAARASHPDAWTRSRQQTRQQLQDSLVLVHGGMAQNVGPILEMVTEKYLLRSEAEWTARLRRAASSTRSWACCSAGDVRGIGDATTRNFFGPIQTIIPWATTLYTETLIDRVRAEFGAQVLGLLDAGRRVGRRHGLHL